MGKATGFLEHTRQTPNKKDVNERIKNYNEFVERFEEKQLNEQSSRCMNCGVPFCHNGCPLGNVIPEFNDAVYKKDYRLAYDILSSTNNFPEFTGRICPAPCEMACVLGINQPPITIEEIEKHIIEIAFEKGFIQAQQPEQRTDKKIAVIGSGPAGLAAAAQLNRVGHNVTVYERDNKPGGLLRYGIPDFKLEQAIIDRRIDLMKAEGITFECSTEVGTHLRVDYLMMNYDAIVLAIGSTIPRDLKIVGRELSGIHFAVDFLKQQNMRVNNTLPKETKDILATDKHVIVIGGGDTGSDCIGTSARQGAKSITQLELMPLPPEQRTSYMPWPTYPMLMKNTTSHEDGKPTRLFAVNSISFEGKNGKVEALNICDVKWEEDAQGRPSSFTPIAGTERKLPCDIAFLAMGFLHPEPKGLLEGLGVNLSSRGNIAANEVEFRTNLDKVFAAGDCRRGQSLVVWAISEGRECARKVDEYLNNGHSKLLSKNKSVFSIMN